MKTLVCIGLGGAFGALARYLAVLGMDRWLDKPVFPWGIFAVNVVGCFLMGLLFGVSEWVRPMSEEWRHALLTGFLGSLTTFSTYGLQGVGLLQQGRLAMAMLYLLGSMVCGLAAVQAGLASAGLAARS